MRDWNVGQGGRSRREFPAKGLYTTYYLLTLEKGSCVVDFHRFRKKIHGFNFWCPLYESDVESI